MALVLADRVRQTTTTTGQGTITLNGTVTGFQSFSAIGNANTTYYAIVGQNSSEWEVGIGTYTLSGTTLSRDTVLSSSAGGTTKTTFSAGTKDVFVTYPAAKSVTTADVQTFDASGTWTKPSIGQFVRIQMWGGGGGGSRGATTGVMGAGGGGGYFELTVPIASMGATSTITVGSAGVGRITTTGVGTNGGNSSVTAVNGSTIYVSGGLGAINSGNGASGGYGALTVDTTAVADPASIGRGGDACSAATSGYSYTGAGGGGPTNTTGGKGVWGGGGGTRGTGAGGTSVLGGAGGNSAGAGVQPGGGGGCSNSINTNATNGGLGRVIITTY
jgi:hypothetical protein